MVGKRRIGILTSGGDCAGLNAVIRAAVHRAIGYGWDVIGIQQATDGLRADNLRARPLRLADVRSILTSGGTILGTINSGTPFAVTDPDGTIRDASAEMIAGYHHLGLSALIGIGGDGSLGILNELARKGEFNFVGIPKTIDNDVIQTEWSVGFSTAVDIATEALDRLHFTAASHSRVMILEVMGRDAGHIAISAGIAGGADIILIPEIPYTIESLAQKIAQNQVDGKAYSLVIVAEAVKDEHGNMVSRTNCMGQCRLGGIGEYLADRLCQTTGAETRVTVLGHLQRGGTPSPLDRLIGSAFGVAAVDLIAQERYGRLVTWQNRQVVDVPIDDIVHQSAPVDPKGTLVQTARGLGICLGDEVAVSRSESMQMQLPDLVYPS
jgi:ATP-dependent phosphofructokinase / diphosphate-dependent phosphofructokinase